MVQNKGLIFKAVPDGPPQIGKDLAVETREFDLDAGPPEGGLTLQTAYISFDPYQRGRMRSPEKKSYSAPFTLGEPLTNRGIARVLKTDSADFAVGDIVKGFLWTEQYSRVSAEQLQQIGLEKLQNPHGLDPAVYLGALGMPGLTAYSSYHEIGQPKKGQTIFVSSAAGAVGIIVGQLAKNEGLRVIGSVGDDEKLKYIKEVGYHDGFNYKKEKPNEALQRLAPDGIDIYYENVGGEHLDAALNALNTGGKIICCGMISQYSKRPDEVYGVKGLMQIVSKQLTMRGFLVGNPDFGPKWTKEHQKWVGKWLADGTFTHKLDVTEGIDKGAEAFTGMLDGKNFGKAVLKIADL